MTHHAATYFAAMHHRNTAARPANGRARRPRGLQCLLPALLCVHCAEPTASRDLRARAGKSDDGPQCSDAPEAKQFLWSRPRFDLLAELQAAKDDGDPGFVFEAGEHQAVEITTPGSGASAAGSGPCAFPFAADRLAQGQGLYFDFSDPGALFYSGRRYEPAEAARQRMYAALLEAVNGPSQNAAEQNATDQNGPSQSAWRLFWFGSQGVVTVLPAYREQISSGSAIFLRAEDVDYNPQLQRVTHIHKRFRHLVLMHCFLPSSSQSPDQSDAPNDEQELLMLLDVRGGPDDGQLWTVKPVKYRPYFDHAVR